MPEGQREIQVTRVALLELRQEQHLAKEGYELLDEKRILLAQEIRRQLRRLGEARARFLHTEGDALAAVKSALKRHGFDEFSVWPSLAIDSDRLEVKRTRLVGIELIEARLQQAAPRVGETPVAPSPEAWASALAYRAWIATAVELAVRTANLRRLAREYMRTERRARAIENVLLPELNSMLNFIEEQLEGLDQEEVARRRVQAALAAESFPIAPTECSPISPQTRVSGAPLEHMKSIVTRYGEDTND